MGLLKILCHKLNSRALFKVHKNINFDVTSCFNPNVQCFYRQFLSVNEIHFVRSCSNTAGSNPKYVSFQKMMQFRWDQARCSVLIEVPSTEDAEYVASLCKDFGSVKSIYSYPGEQSEIYLLTEYDKIEDANTFLKACQVKNVIDSFPTFSRIVYFERKKKRKNSRTNSDIIDSTKKPFVPKQTNLSVSDIISSVYKTESLTDLNTRLRFLFGCIMEESLRGLFPECAAFPFGSSVNSFGKEGCDLDLMIRLYPDKINLKSEFYFQNKTVVGEQRVLQQRSISCIYELLRAFIPGISYIQRILSARVPILKFRHKILNLECDVSVNNMSAVYMSEILYFLGELDSRVRPLVFAVKRWAKLANITYASPGSWITNFSLTLLVIFFLQNRKPAILPPLNKAVDLSECHESGSFHSLKYINKPETWMALANQNKEDLGTLLQEFFHFVAKFEFSTKCISPLAGKAMNFSNGYPLWIQYPLEEDLNVSKNVSAYEIQQFVSIAAATANNLSIQRTSDCSHSDFATLLGIPMIKEKFERIDISALYDDTDVANKKKGTQRAR